MDKKALSLLSLCMRAGKVLAGELACEKALQSESAKLVIVANDASDNTKKKFINKAFHYKVPAFVWGTRDEISKAIGKQNRVTVVITDVNFAKNLQKLAEVASTENVGDMEVGECLN